MAHQTCIPYVEIQTYPAEMASLSLFHGQEQYYFQMKCTAQVYPKFSHEVFKQWSRAEHLQMMCTGAESPSSLPPPPIEHRCIENHYTK